VLTRLAAETGAAATAAATISRDVVTDGEGVEISFLRENDVESVCEHGATPLLR
jgi:hypothetical protein